MTSDVAAVRQPVPPADAPPAGLADPPARITRIAIGLILLGAFLLRAWHRDAGVPFAVGADEPAIIGRALAILRSGDWNTHVFDYPALVIYLHAIAAIPWYLWGASRGLWSSLATMDIVELYAFERLLSAAIGVWTVWLVYRIGEELDGARLGLVAAAQLAALSLHVRESHFVLTDVPTTALTALTILLAVRASRLGTDASFAWAGAAAGFAASAKYNGGLVVVAPLIVWAGCAWQARTRGRTLAAIVLAAVAAFVVGTPYGLIDLPAFLSGYGEQVSRFVARRLPGDGDPTWLAYYKNLARPLAIWPALALAGAAVGLVRRRSRLPWAAIVGFGAVYAYALASRSVVFARYALPLLPVLALAAALAIVELGRWAGRLSRKSARRLAPWVVPVAAGAIVVIFSAQSIRWLRQRDRVDTRTVAVRWLQIHAPRGVKVAVEGSPGPTYLEEGGLRAEVIGRLDEHRLEWYAAEGFDYLLISSDDPRRPGLVFPSEPAVFTASPGPTQQGPTVRIIKRPGR